MAAKWPKHPKIGKCVAISRSTGRQCRVSAITYRDDKKVCKVHYAATTVEFVDGSTEKKATNLWHKQANINLDKHYSSPRWKRVRKAVYARLGDECFCGKKADQVHHLRYDHLPEHGGSEDEEVLDCVPVCRECHQWMVATRKRLGASYREEFGLLMLNLWATQGMALARQLRDLSFAHVKRELDLHAENRRLRSKIGFLVSAFVLRSVTPKEHMHLVGELFDDGRLTDILDTPRVRLICALSEHYV